MKKIFLSFIVLVFGFCANAQLAKWVISPSYDTISVKVDNRILYTDSAGISTLWTMDGTRLFSTSHQIMPFHEGLATVVDRQNNSYVGFVDMSGKFTQLPNVNVVYNNPYFNNGYLIYKDSYGYGYYRADGQMASIPVGVRFYPFNNGYAPYLTYAEFDKQKDPHYNYLTTTGRSFSCVIRSSNGKEKEFEPKDIRFLSGVGNDGRGVAVIDDRLYWFDAKSGIFLPMLGEGTESEKKRHLKLAGNYTNYFLNLPAENIGIRAEYGKKQIALLQFDSELIPIKFTFDGKDMVFTKETTPTVEYETSLQSYNDGIKNGLIDDGIKVLPPQFTSVGLMYGRKAFVKLDDKWGIVEILPNIGYTISINKGEDIAFRHQKFETQIRLDLPPVISAKEARIDISDTTGCSIDKTSRETKDTESGNFVVYDCSLTIPHSLPDTITTITYSPVVVTYDGLTMFDIPVNVRAWHLKYYNVDPIDSETTIENGVASFIININAQRNVGEGDYPFEVRIEADSVIVQYEKISETRYKCIVSNLQEGENNLNIFVTEKGCPPSIFPFEITYQKKRKQEAVAIRKRSLKPKTDPVEPRLEI